MAPVTNKRIIFKELLKGSFVPGQTTVFDGSQTIDVDNVSLNGGVLLKTLVLSLEPYVLVKMMPGLPVSYKIGESIQGYGVGVVVCSENPAFQVGDHLHGFYPFEEYSIQTNTEAFSKIDNKYGLPWSAFIGIAGLPEIAFVTSGAGAVGSLVIQLAKRDGMKVIASAGLDDKVQFLKDLGANVAFNYKTTKTSEVLEKEGPIDVYWDNVGGEALEVALNAAAKYAQFIECGMISGYFGDTYLIRNLMNVIIKEISFNGFTIASLFPKYMKTFGEEVPALLASKELTYRETVTKGLENAEVADDDFLKGAFTGMSIVAVADE